MSESYPGCWKGILPTPAPFKIPKITHRGDAVNRAEGFKETDWEHCAREQSKRLEQGQVGRKLCHGKNNSEGHSPKRLSTERQRYNQKTGTPRWLSGKEFACQCERCGFNPRVRKIPRRRKWQPTPVYLPGKSHGQRRLTGVGPLTVHGVAKELNMIQRLNNKHNLKIIESTLSLTPYHHTNRAPIKKRIIVQRLLTQGFSPKKTSQGSPKSRGKTETRIVKEFETSSNWIERTSPALLVDSLSAEPRGRPQQVLQQTFNTVQVLTRLI